MIKTDFIKLYEGLNELQETIRIVSDPNILYHYTNPTPLYKILTNNCLRADVNLRAVCLTSDKDYVLYGYPCGMQFSRERLVKAGYELFEVDEWAHEPDNFGESEERIYKNITNVIDYITHIHINWENISIVQSAQGPRIADAVYDDLGDEYEVYDLKLEDFVDLLTKLKAKGIQIVEKGEPVFGEYYLDTNGNLQYGEMPDYEMLTEAKQDTINFKNYFIKNGRSEEEADRWVKRFDGIKSTLKAPENDYYYWIKIDKLQDLFELILDTERYLEVKRTKKAEVEQGAELVYESEHWKIYHITNFEAAQVYGRDSKWCITGVGTYGDRYWNDYTDRGFDFYFAITKDEYDPRGIDSKFAFAINDEHSYYQIFNQQDHEVYIDDVPYNEEIEIPGVNLDEYDTEEPCHCDWCGAILASDGDDTWWSPNGDMLCQDCFDRDYFHCADCGEVYSNDRGAEGTDGDMYCCNCWAEHFYECSQCWEAGDLDDAHYDENGEVYCPDCYADYLEEQEDD